MQTYKVTVDDKGTIRWSDQEGKRHREDGPAWEDANGLKVWYWHGERHREDGPAYEYPNGTKEWYLHGKPFVNEEDWKKAKKAKQAEASSSCEGKVVEIDGKKYKLTSV